ncbi:tyramine receptor Ser-2-like [Patiria miniata]|uniref:G-protein coupled receptors family 1 profile domain-containing protein n=1 Tax=Patiria miniata TaxID=46514 RepID=A0A914A2L8_PATMI|nr:tyramine receptor Ser-2-like [Patiria miniata]
MGDYTGSTGSNLTTPGLDLPGTTEIYIPMEFDLTLEMQSIFVPVIVITLCIGLLANFLAVFITFKCAKENREHKVTIPGILVRALLAIDTSAAMFFMVRGCCLFIYQKTWIQCDLDLASNLIFSWASGLVNMLMSCDRCLALGAPFFYHAHATRARTYLTLVLSILASAALSMLPVFGFGAYKVYVGGEYHCLAPGDLRAEATDFDFSFNVMFFTLGLGVLVITYIANAVVLRQILKLRRRLVVVIDSEMSRAQNSTEGEANRGGGTSRTSPRTIPGNNTLIPRIDPKEKAHGTTNHQAGNNISTVDLGDEARTSRSLSTSRERTSSCPKQPDAGRTEMRFGIMILVFSMVFTLSWLPFYIQRLVKAITGFSTQTTLLIVIYLLTLNHVIDPFVYVLMKPQYRKKFNQLCRRWRSIFCKRCHSNEGTTSSATGGEVVVRSVSSANLYGNRRNSLGTTLITSCTMTAGHGYGTNAWLGLTQPHAPMIQVTAATPSLASEPSRRASSTDAALDEIVSLDSSCTDSSAGNPGIYLLGDYQTADHQPGGSQPMDYQARV